MYMYMCMPIGWWQPILTGPRWAAPLQPGPGNVQPSGPSGGTLRCKAPWWAALPTTSEESVNGSGGERTRDELCNCLGPRFDKFNYQGCMEMRKHLQPHKYLVNLLGYETLVSLDKEIESYETQKILQCTRFLVKLLIIKWAFCLAFDVDVAFKAKDVVVACLSYEMGGGPEWRACNCNFKIECTSRKWIRTDLHVICF